MSNKKIGYIVLNFSEKVKNDFVKYFQKEIKKDDYFFVDFGDVKKGGLVLNKLHLTLFFGLDYEKFDKKILNKIKIKNVKLNELELFYIKEFDCNALVLRVNDKDKVLEKYHKELSKSKTIKESINYFSFKPHLTIAYVKKDFKLKNKKYFKGKVLEVENVVYRVKNLH